VHQNNNRVDHVVWICRTENQRAYVEQLSKLCQVRFHGPVDKQDRGARLYLSWASGLEVVAPLAGNPNGQALRDHLERHGEGLMSVVFGVPDIEEAQKRAASLGYAPSDIIQNQGDEPYAHETETMKEVVVGEVINARFVFGEIRYHDDLLR
jgi:4-hydroxyphenylpyruvate dioxygenase-like putative hemolysin